MSQVLYYLRSLGPNGDLSLKLQSQKLVVLLALALAHCCSDLSRLTLQGRKYSAEGAVLRNLMKKQQVHSEGKISCLSFWPLIHPIVQSQLQLLQDG